MNDIIGLGTGIGAILTGLGVIGSIFYLDHQGRTERIASDNRWAEMKTTNDQRWLATETKILAIMNRLEMRYTDPIAPNAKEKKFDL